MKCFFLITSLIIAFQAPSLKRPEQQVLMSRNGLLRSPEEKLAQGGSKLIFDFDQDLSSMKKKRARRRSSSPTALSFRKLNFNQ